MPASVLSCLSRVSLLATLWTVSCQAPLSMRFSRQVDWSGLTCPPAEDLPDPGIKPTSLMSPALAGQVLYLPLEPPGKPYKTCPILIYQPATATVYIYQTCCMRSNSANSANSSMRRDSFSTSKISFSLFAISSFSFLCLAFSMSFKRKQFHHVNYFATKQRMII